MWLDSNKFVYDKIPEIHPLSLDYLEFWREEKRRIIEGYWYNGVYCPAQLYHYLNYAQITITEGKNRRLSRPFNLDYVWDVAYNWLEARGFSGFEKTGDVKDVRALLRTRQKEDLGKPLYNYEAKNLFILGPRGWGKSFWAANCAAHEYITDGRKEYVPGEPVTNVAEILLGAYASVYVNDLIAKVQDILSHYPGGMQVGTVYHPPPFHKTVGGTWAIGKKAENYYDKKVGGKWLKAGTRSCFKPRVYKDNHLAGVGGRNTVKIAEEIGVWDNLIESHFADENTQKLNNYKFGSAMYIGTGGDMVGGGTLAAQKMMYDPEAYDCLVFDDVWEKRGKIGLFYPSTYTKLNYKDTNGITNFELAIKGEEAERELKRAAKDSQAYDEYVVYNPIVPSEIFLAKTGNLFPLKDLQYTLAKLESDEKLRDKEWLGYFDIGEGGNVEWRNSVATKPIYDFPMRSGVNKDGAVVIYEHPITDEEGNFIWGRYIGGIDPYDHDHSNTDSLGSCIILDRLTNRVVAEYSGRPQTAEEFYETTRRLLIYFGAVALYENEKKGIFTYFEKMNSLHLLHQQPKLLKDIIPNSSVHRGYGMHMILELKKHGERLINFWLRDSYEGEIRNVHRIRCIPLLKELILFNYDNNFDRVMSFMMVMYLKEELHRHVIKEETRVKSLLDSDFFKKGMPRYKHML